VNGVNGGDTVFVRCVSLSVCVCAQRTAQSDQFKTVKDTDFKFDVHVFQKVAWPGSRDPLNFWALNAYSSKMVKATDFKFDTHVPRDSPDMTPCSLGKRERL